MTDPDPKQRETDLKQKRGRIKGSLTRAKTYIENISIDIAVEELQSRLEKLDKLWEEFVNVDDMLATLNISSEIEEFESNFFSICALYRQAISERRVRLNSQRRNSELANQTAQLDSNHSVDNNTVIDQFNSTLTRFVEQQRTLWDSYANSSSTHNSTDIRLPKVNIPIFIGDFKEWPSFKDLFVAMVDQRTGLSAVQKFQYLKGLVKGEAASLIKHLAITDSNYKEAWGKLTSRYDKKKYILTEYVKSFYNLPTVSQGSQNQLRQLTDTADELIRGVNALGEAAKGRDPWLIYTILSKVDADTRKQWSEESVGVDTPTLEEFFKFLDKRCDAVQAYDMPLRKIQTRSSHSAEVMPSQGILKCIRCSESHQLFRCPQFRSMDVESRRAFVSKRHLCFNCLSQGHPANRCKSKNLCHQCAKSHHTLLHDSSSETKLQSLLTETGHTELFPTSQDLRNDLNPDATPFVTAGDENNKMELRNILASHATSCNNEIFLPILPTASVYVDDALGNSQICRVLIDSGSQGSFVSEDCATRLGHKREPAKMLVHGIGSCKSGFTRGRVFLTLRSRYDKNKRISISAYILPRLTSPQPTSHFNYAKFLYINEFNIADPNFNLPGKIDIILGTEYFVDILEEGKYISTSSGPKLQNTLFGYVVSGSIDASPNPSKISSHHSDICDIDKTLRSFWEIEELPRLATPYTDEEQYCEKLFLETHRVDKDTGRYIVRLPIKHKEIALGQTINLATSRLKSMEKRFNRDKEFHLAYQSFMEEYKTLGHMEPLMPSASHSSIEHAYLPHHAVIKPSSTTTKLRVVFDGSVSSDSGISLNEKLCVGPKVQRDLFPILISFRTYKIAVVADIKQMFRQILVNELDREYQRIVWRESCNQPIQHYRLTTVTYGTSAAPFLATRSLKQVAEDFKEKYPLAAKAINENFYVDDLLGGADNVEAAERLYQELTYALSARAFPLHKWASNSGEFLTSIGQNTGISPIQIEPQTESMKVLGLKWKPDEDYFTIDVSTSDMNTPTKRLILSESSKIFDPLGLLSPVTVVFKIMLQQLWLENYNWDEPLREALLSKWKSMHTTLRSLTKLQLPRWLHTSLQAYELHGFANASEAAYAAVVYCRVVTDTKEVSIRLIAAKTRVAPINRISVPRLELNAALLLSKLLLSIKMSLNRTDLTCIAWTDSKIVLDWLSSHPCYWKTYVANRTSEILSILPRPAWHHVHSQYNPADLASRGMLPKDLVNSSLWWNGPSYLTSDWDTYIHEELGPSNTELINSEKKPQVIRVFQTIVQNDTLMELFNKKSSLMQILNILARCIQFIKHCKGLRKLDAPWITSGDIKAANRICIKWTQQSAFSDEIMALERHRTIPTSSTLLSLSPFLDYEGVLRVGGRLDRANCDYETKHPAILPRDHPFVRLLIGHLHENICTLELMDYSASSGKGIGYFHAVHLSRHT